MVRQLEEVAQKTGCVEWKLRHERLALELRGILEAISAEESVGVLLDLLEQAIKANSLRMEIELRSLIIEFYWLNFKNYELAFDLLAVQEERLQEISSEEFPEKALFYIQIANSHYYFKDYEKAILYFRKVLEFEDNTRNQLPKQSARNGIGLIYRFHFNNLDQSDRYFNAIMQVTYLRAEEDYHRDLWNGIAQGNLGRNMLLCGEYDQAIPLLKSSIEKTLRFDDYGFASGAAMNLADIYLKKGNIQQGKHYIDLAREYHAISPRDGIKHRIFKALSNYYALIGNAKLSMIYMDSTLKERERQENQFSALHLMRAEQRRHLSEQQLKAEQLRAEQYRTSGYRKSLVISIIALLLIAGLFARYIVLYRKKQVAYRELVLKTQEWAAVKPEIVEEKPDNPPDEFDISIMKDIERLLSEEKLYTEMSLTVDSLAQKLDMKKHHVSLAINRCTNKNFNTFINEYRIKEAVRRISGDSEKLSFEGIAWEIGFSDRKSFYRAFKKEIGITPKEFRSRV